MKSLLIILLVAISFKNGLSQDEEFPTVTDLLLEIQYRAESLHTKMEATFDNARFIMSSALDSLNNAAIEEIITELESLKKLKESTEMNLLRSRLPTSCTENYKKVLQQRDEAAGELIASCASVIDEAIIEMTFQFYTKVEELQVVSTDLQNIVIRSFITWNPIISSYDIWDISNAKFEDIEYNWNYVEIPILSDILQEIFDAETVYIAELRTCLDDAKVGVKTTVEDVVNLNKYC